MTRKGSRYENVKPFSSETDIDFSGLRPRKINEATGVLEYSIKEGDRLDLLALHFYNDTRRWWRILDANPHILFGADLMLDDSVGQIILIPRSRPETKQ